MSNAIKYIGKDQLARHDIKLHQPIIQMVSTSFCINMCQSEIEKSHWSADCI